MIKKTKIIAVVVFILVMNTSTIFADSSRQIADNQSLNIKLAEDIKFDRSEKESLIAYGKTLQNLLKSADKKEYDNVLIKRLEEDGEAVGNILDKKIQLKVKNVLTKYTKKIEVELDETVMNESTFAFKIDEQTTLVLTPSYVILSKVESTPLSVLDCISAQSGETNLLASGNSVKGSASKTIRNYEGLEVATVKVSAEFDYNGAKAWYKGGLDGSLTCPSFGNHVVVNGSRNKYHGNYAADGSSYCAAYYGKINQINDIVGIPQIIKTRLIQAMVICYRNGMTKEEFENYVV